MPSLLLLGFSLLLASAQSPEQAATPAKVTFSEAAAPLSRLMPHLAELTKLPLKVSKAMETEVVLVSVHDVSVTDLLKHVASATGGMWTQSDNTYYLSPSVPVREALKQRGYKARVAKLTLDLKKMDPANQPKKPKSAEAQFDVGMMFGTHGDAVFYQLLSAIGPQQLANLLTGERAVLSTKPLARQFPLNGSEEIISAYIQRHNAEADKLAEKVKQQMDQAGGDESGVTSTTVTDEMSTGFSPFGATQRINGRAEKALLILTRQQGMVAIFGSGELSAELVLYDAAGKEVGRDRASLGSYFDADEMEELMAAGMGKAKPTTETPLELSPESKLFAKHLREMQMNAGQNSPKGMTAEEQKQFTEKLMHPELFDPIAYPADLLAAYAKAKNLQIVASLPDTFSSWLISLMLGAPTTSSIEKKLANDTGLVVDNSEGWLAISPGEFRVEPMNRVDLASIMATFSGRKDPTIDQLAAAALAGLGDPEHGMLSELWVILAAPSLATMFGEDWDMLRFYGALTPEQRTALFASKRLSIGALDGGQQALLERMIYGASSGMFSFFGGEAPLKVEQKRDQGSLLDGADAIFNDTMEMYGLDGESPHDYRGEPTEVAPNGLPSGTAITLKVSNVQVLEPEIKGKNAGPAAEAYSQPMGIEQIAGMVAMRDSPQFSQMSANFPTFDHVKIGSKRNLHFRIYVSPESFKSSSLSDCSFPPGQTYSLNNLPGDLQKKYNDALKQMRDAYKNAPPDGVDGKAVPPR